jgi:hypothetical protein
MFRYDDTGKLSQPGEKQNKVIVKTRKMTYHNPILDRKGKPVIDRKTKEPLIKTSYGYEIVKEIVADPKGEYAQ